MPTGLIDGNMIRWPALDYARIARYVQQLRASGVAKSRAESIARKKAERKRWYKGTGWRCIG